VSETENEKVEAETTSAGEPEAPVAPAAEEPAETEAEAVESPEETAPPAAEAEGAAGAEGTVPSGDSPRPQRSRKHVPRAQRRQRPKTKRGSAEGVRKPIVRQPKPDRERGRRQERRGVVVSSAMDKTIVVKVDVIKMHQRYKKVIRRSQKFHAHDEQNQANVGDVVRIVETRPLSKTKSWRLAEVVEAAK